MVDDFLNIVLRNEVNIYMIVWDIHVPVLLWRVRVDCSLKLPREKGIEGANLIPHGGLRISIIIPSFTWGISRGDFLFFLYTTHTLWVWKLWERDFVARVCIYLMCRRILSERWEEGSVYVVHTMKIMRIDESSLIINIQGKLCPQMKAIFWCLELLLSSILDLKNKRKKILLFLFIYFKFFFL